VRSQHLVQSLVEWPIVAMLVASSNRIAFDAKEGMVIRTFVQIAGTLSARAAKQPPSSFDHRCCETLQIVLSWHRETRKQEQGTDIHGCSERCCRLQDFEIVRGFEANIV
jgi:hypothetical protein